jgi:hypothetical protein
MLKCDWRDWDEEVSVDARNVKTVFPVRQAAQGGGEDSSR